MPGIQGKRRTGESLHYKEILKRLKTEEDFEPGSKRPETGVLFKLSLDRFYRHDTGVYGLTEWREGGASE